MDGRSPLSHAARVPVTRASFAALGVVIPCHNEAATIAAVVASIRALSPARVFVVDDGSSDDTADRARAAGAEVIRLSPRHGKGAALARGWEACHRAGLAWILMLDGDGQHDPAEADALLAAAGPWARLVVGDRSATAHAMPWIRRWTNRVMSRCLSRLAGEPLRDSQCGFRLAHEPTLRSLQLSARHFEIESEMCLAFARAGHGVAFAPITCHYGAERSKIHAVRDTLRWMRWLLRTVTRFGGSRPTVASPAQHHPRAVFAPHPRTGQARGLRQAAPFLGAPSTANRQHGVVA